jgi:hypothetical protein
MIVKVQVSLPEGGPIYIAPSPKRILIYDEAHAVVFEAPVTLGDIVALTDALEEARRRAGPPDSLAATLIGTVERSFWQAELNEDEKIVLDHPVPDEEW